MNNGVYLKTMKNLRNRIDVKFVRNKNSSLKWSTNKKAVGKIKDETAGVAIEEFDGIKPKMYSYLVNDNNEHKKAKGVNRNIVARKCHKVYKDVLLNEKYLRHLMNSI